MDKYLPAAAQMNDISSQIHLLIYVVVGVGITVLGTFGAVMKWYIPARFKQQTAERELRLNEVKNELDSKRASEAVDIEREKILPTLLENMMQSNRSTIQMAESFHTTMLQGVQQTATYVAQLTAHDRQLSANTDRLEELAQTVDTAITNIQLLKKVVDESADHSKSAAAYSDKAEKAATSTLEFVKRELHNIVSENKSDTGELKTITVPLDDLPKASGQ